jgi:nucleotide-binding universal stress UspA family protein
MFRWMVAVDGSESAREAFNTAVSLMNKYRDELFIITTVQNVGLPIVSFQRYSEEVEEMHRTYLIDYSHRCDELGVKNYTPIMARGSHIGAMICKAAEQKSADFLVLGRRGMNRFSRMITGSTSKYCMENATCNVIITKGCYVPEDHSVSRYDIRKMEEQERERRIRELGEPEEHSSSRSEIKNIEERERERRIRDKDYENARMRAAEHEAEIMRQHRNADERRLGERLERFDLRE